MHLFQAWIVTHLIVNPLGPRTGKRSRCYNYNFLVLYWDNSGIRYSYVIWVRCWKVAYKVRIQPEGIICPCFSLVLYHVLVCLQRWFNSCLFWNFYRHALGNIQNLLHYILLHLSSTNNCEASPIGVLQNFVLYCGKYNRNYEGCNIIFCGPWVCRFIGRNFFSP